MQIGNDRLMGKLWPFLRSQGAVVDESLWENQRIIRKGVTARNFHGMLLSFH